MKALRIGRIGQGAGRPAFFARPLWTAGRCLGARCCSLGMRPGALLALLRFRIRDWRRRGAFWGLVTLLPIAQMAATGTFLSGHRILLACLPGFIELADLLRNRLAYWTTAVLFAVVQLFLLSNYIHWIFAG